MKNQSPPFVDLDLFATNPGLRDAVGAAGLRDQFDALSEFGMQWGSAEAFDLGRLANENPPRLRSVDPRGDRLEEVEFHPAYHELMRRSMAGGLHASTWEGASHALRAAQLYMVYQVESGHVCPIVMTHAALAALAAEPALEAQWRPKIAARAYDPRSAPWRGKTAVTLGMAMTELQGGTDVRSNETRAVRAGEGYEIHGSKWFMSAPMSDAFVTLAQADGGLTCFLVPRLTPDGALNGLRLQRLKDKLGDRSNASSEAAFEGAVGERIGAEGQGLATILAMVQMTRLDCAVASAGLMRFSLAHTERHCRSRRAFGRSLIDLPAMRAVLADLALESEAVTALVIALARAFDRAAADEQARAYARLLTPAVKYLVCKTAPAFIYECMECHGGNGYVEDWPLARAYRQAPVNAIWEGSGNVMALDVLRAARRDRDAAAAAIASLRPPGGAGRLIDLIIEKPTEGAARRAVERLARAAALAALRRSAPSLADAYEAARFHNGIAASTWGSADLCGAENMLVERIAS